jgi:hypothetical protein
MIKRENMTTAKTEKSPLNKDENKVALRLTIPTHVL